MSQKGVIFPIALNIGVSVCLIVINKALISKWAFHYSMTLTFLHFCLTGFTMWMLSMFGVFTPKPVRVSVIGLFAATGLLSIVFSNLTLQFNSVGFYQLAKLCCVPATVAVEYSLFKKKFSCAVLLSLAVLLLGVGGATITDVEFNWKGLGFGVLGVIFTTWYQIWIGLLYGVSPYWMGSTFVIAVISDIMVPLQHNASTVLHYELSGWTVVLLCFSCLFAVGVNFSGFLLVKVTSALTYMVIGHAKTMIILSSSFFLFGSPLHVDNATCIMIAFVGFVSYGYFKSRQQEASTTQHELTAVNQSAEKDVESIVGLSTDENDKLKDTRLYNDSLPSETLRGLLLEGTRLWRSKVASVLF